MNDTFRLEAETPNREEVLLSQGVPRGAALPERVRDLLEEAIEVYLVRAELRGIMASISGAEFKSVHFGEGRNPESTPLELIYRQARGLALFAVTLGSGLSEEIERRFADHDPAFGFMLDSVSSAGAEMAVGGVCERWRQTNVGTAALAYSPGYCGWHISGQRALFDVLRPQRIAIDLNSSYLMQPLKSVSGILVAGPPEIHMFDNSYPFCEQCSTKNCRVRIAGLNCDPDGRTSETEKTR